MAKKVKMVSVTTYIPVELLESLKRFKKSTYIKSVSSGIREAIEEKYIGESERQTEYDKKQMKITEFKK